ncbi:MAG: FecR domain-containing protein [Candidatus Riflebacteria bacterium]|nr:FecR domain-containing protein [Candidatus Riflebacteria bacterium]
MTTDNFCERFIEEISGRSQLSADASAHLRSCQACREARQVVESLIREGSAVRPAASHVAIKRIVMGRINAPAAEPANEWGHGFQGAIAAAAVVLMAVCLWMFSGDHRSAYPGYPGISPNTYLITSTYGISSSAPLDQPFILASGSARLTAPDGSIFEAVAPIDMSVASRGFHLTNGILIASVQPGKIPFIGTTPHGNIEVLGTVFKVRVNRENSIVSVISGKVQVTPFDGVGKTFIANQSTAMVDSYKAPIGSTTKFVPSIDGDGETKNGANAR